LLLLRGPAWVTVSGTAFAYLALFLLGSRTALLAASIAVLSLVIAKWRPARMITIGAIAAMSIVTVLFGLSDSFQRDPGASVSSRQEIWTVALDGFLGSPLRGIGTSFAEFWATESPASSTVSHAHNLWLVAAVQHGALGLAGAVLLTILTGIVLWRKHRWNGAAFFIALAVLNTFDYTMNFPGVWVPLIIALLLPAGISLAQPRSKG
ncbi:MAG: O-antigen ligase family protein, partial [Trueperaceae bacterium]